GARVGVGRDDGGELQGRGEIPKGGTLLLRCGRQAAEGADQCAAAPARKEGRRARQSRRVEEGGNLRRDERRRSPGQEVRAAGSGAAQEIQGCRQGLDGGRRAREGRPPGVQGLSTAR